MTFAGSVLAAGLMVSLAGCASSTGSEEMTLAEGAKRECRSIKEFGSMLPKRICNNKATWADIDERNEEQAKEFKDKIDSRYTPIPREPGM
mgnify:FL=1